MQTAQFSYPLPPERIAQFPPTERTASRLLAVPDDNDAKPAILQFADIGRLLTAGDILVANDTRVLPARLFARKSSGGKVEIMLERVLSSNRALVQLRANKSLRLPQKLLVGDIAFTASERRDNFFIIDCDAHDIAAIFRAHGTTPLPPYIARQADAQDDERYQTVYAAREGAVAAPTAGLHFDRALIDQLIRAGIEWTTITLHIGAGTFQPVRDDSPAAHSIHREWLEVNAQTCAQINRAKSRGRRIVAVGTTVVRALETAARGDADASVSPFCGDTDLYILPGHQFRAVDALITNFHLPRSTLLMMVCAFGGYARTMRAYRHAIDCGLQFYSYGDAMFIARQQ